MGKPQDVRRVEKNVISGPYTLARNSFHNLATNFALMLMGVWAIPLLVTGLTAERFGLLSLIWTVLGYFSLLDFGVSRATTKYVADSLAKSDHKDIAATVSTSTGVTLVIALIVSLLLWVATPWLISSVFAVPQTLRAEAITVSHLTAVALPFVLVGGVFRGVLMAYHRFDLVNILQLILGSAQWGGSVLLLYKGFGLEEIIQLSVFVRAVLTLVAYLLLQKVISSRLRFTEFLDGQTAKKLLKFGGWVAISQLISPLFQYFDRLLIGALLTLTAVAHYSVPQEIVGRLLVIPLSLTTVLFPTFSQLSVQEKAVGNGSSLYARSTKYLFAFVFPLTVLAIAFASEFLTWWVGKDFADESVLVFQIISVGFLFNAVAQIPATALQAAGYPDLGAKFHLLEVVPTLLVTIFFITVFGIEGAAAAWTLRVVADCILLFMAAHRHLPESAHFRVLFFTQAKILAHQVFFLIIAIASAILAIGMTKIGLFALAFLLHSISLWFIVFDDVDRVFFLRLKEKLFEVS